MSNNKLFFSIVIPTLNEEYFLPHLLKCLSQQTFSHFEVIICDGNSIDKTISEAEKFKKQIPRLEIITKQKRNVAYQRNKGAEKAQGQYLVFFDADVVFERDFLGKLHEQLQNKNVPLATTWLVPDSQHPADEALVFLTNLVVETSRFIDFPMAPGFDIIIKRNLFAKIGGFDEKVKLAEDHDFVRRALIKNINLTVFKEPKLTVSLRRLRKEGRLQVARKYTQASLYILLKGPITKELFDYQMGGDYHQTIKTPKKRLLKYLQNFPKNSSKKVIKTIKELLEY